jgi:hypothetical protein
MGGTSLFVIFVYFVVDKYYNIPPSSLSEIHARLLVLLVKVNGRGVER